MAGWGEDAPAEAANALSVLLSRLRHGLGPEHLQGRAEIELLLPSATFVDVEAEQWRRRLEESRLRGLECFAAAALGLGGPALAQAEEHSRRLTPEHAKTESISRHRGSPQD